MTEPYNSEIVINVDPSYVPEDGNAFDAVVSALDHFGIPAAVVERDPRARARIVIGLEGGLVQGVTADTPVEYLVYDYDTEGCSDDELATRPALDGGEVEVYAAGYFFASVEEATIAKVFEVVAAEDLRERVCAECGADVPDGAEVCQRCFEVGKR